MEKPLVIDLLTYALVAISLWWMFSLMQTHGPGPWLLASAVSVLAVGLLLIYNQRLAYLRIGNHTVLETRDMQQRQRDSDDEPSEWQKENR
jgi:hypothetical protein